MSAEARDRAIEVLTEELDQHAGSGADAAEWAVDALLAHPEVLRALAGDEMEPGRWWRVVAHGDRLWCETSNEDEARRALLMCPYDFPWLERLFERSEREWRRV